MNYISEIMKRYFYFCFRAMILTIAFLALTTAGKCFENRLTIQSQDSLDYFPLALGNEWVYGGFFAPDCLVFAISDTVRFDSLLYYKYASFPATFPGNEPQFPYYFRSDSAGRILANFGGEDIVWFDFTVAPGDTYHVSIPDSNLRWCVTVGHIEENFPWSKTEDFRNVLWFFFDDYIIDGGFSLAFAPDIGIISRHTFLYERMLCSAIIDGKPFPDSIRTGIHLEETSTIPEQFILHGNYPNPFAHSTTVHFEIEETSANIPIEIAVYNVLGQKVQALSQSSYATGRYQIAWDGTNHNRIPLSSGLYFMIFKSENFIAKQKILLLRDK